MKQGKDIREKDRGDHGRVYICRATFVGGNSNQWNDRISGIPFQIGNRAGL